VSTSIALRQRVQQCLRLLHVGGVKALGEPAVDLSQKLSGFDALVLALAQPLRLHSAMSAELPVSGAIACRLA
jgi:hypothetical protein